MTKEERYEQIERYLGGRMSEMEREAFEKKMRGDATLSAEVDLHREIEMAVSDPKMDELSKKIRNIQNIKSGSIAKKRRRSRFRRILQIAAILLIVSSFYFIFLFQNNRYSTHEALADAFFELPDAPFRLDTSPARNENTDTNDESEEVIIRSNLSALWNEYEEAYKASAYEEALNTLERIHQADPEFQKQESNEWYFNNGLILLKQQKAKKAIENFENVHSYFTEKADWYKALAYLKTKNGKDKSKEILKIIASSAAHPNKKEAEKALKKLEKIK